MDHDAGAVLGQYDGGGGGGGGPNPDGLGVSPGKTLGLAVVGSTLGLVVEGLALGLDVDSSANGFTVGMEVGMKKLKIPIGAGVYLMLFPEYTGAAVLASNAPHSHRSHGSMTV